MNDEQRMTIKRNLTSLAKHPGWAYIKKLAHEIEQRAIEATLTADTPIKAEMCRAEARAARKIFKQLFEAVDASIAFDINAAVPEWFSELDPFGMEPGNETQN
jgi:hypothetical protein